MELCGDCGKAVAVGIGRSHYCSQCATERRRKQALGLCQAPGCNNSARAHASFYCSNVCANRIARRKAIRGEAAEHRHARELHERATRTAMRTCLGKCGKPFLSEGPWNRICPVCSGHRNPPGKRHPARHAHTSHPGAMKHD